MREAVQECLTFWRARGNPKGYHDWESAVRNWMVKDRKMARERKQHEYPQEAGVRGKEPEALEPQLRLILGEKR